MTARRLASWSVVCLLVVSPAGAVAGEGTTFEERIARVVRSSALGSEITVIRLYHARAEEMAETLRRVLPPEVTVVPDVPTNSLIVAVPLRPGASPLHGQSR